VRATVLLNNVDEFGRAMRAGMRLIDCTQTLVGEVRGEILIVEDVRERGFHLRP